MKKILIITAFILMIGWTLFDYFAPSEKKIPIKNSSSLVSMTTHHLSNNIKPEELTAHMEEEQEEENSEDIIGLELGNIAPDFELTTLDGDEVSLSDFRGQRVLLNFWATWCPPCRAEMPDIEEFYLNHDVVVLAVNLTDAEPNVQQVQDFVDEYYLSFPILLDETVSVATMYEIQPIPTSYLIDSNGVIQNKAFGPLTYDLMVEEFEKMN